MTPFNKEIRGLKMYQGTNSLLVELNDLMLET